MHKTNSIYFLSFKKKWDGPRQEVAQGRVPSPIFKILKIISIEFYFIRYLAVYFFYQNFGTISSRHYWEAVTLEYGLESHGTIRRGDIGGWSVFSSIIHKELDKKFRKRSKTNLCSKLIIF